jgi:hypothetical protein
LIFLSSINGCVGWGRWGGCWGERRDKASCPGIGELVAFVAAVVYPSACWVCHARHPTPREARGFDPVPAGAGRRAKHLSTVARPVNPACGIQRLAMQRLW